jgi:hypothetical protein
MLTVLLFFFIIVIFSLLTVWEILLLRRAGFDIFGHLKLSYQTGKSGKFFFEALGVVAFIIAQPIILTWLLVWLSNNFNPEILKKGMAIINWQKHF